MHDIAGEELVPIIKEARERFNDASNEFAPTEAF